MGGLSVLGFCPGAKSPGPWLATATTRAPGYVGFPRRQVLAKGKGWLVGWWPLGRPEVFKIQPQHQMAFLKSC